MRATEHEMPVELRKRIALLKWICVELRLERSIIVLS
jgi:hypothetical protein